MISRVLLDQARAWRRAPRRIRRRAYRAGVVDLLGDAEHHVGSNDPVEPRAPWRVHAIEVASAPAVTRRPMPRALPLYQEVGADRWSRAARPTCGARNSSSVEVEPLAAELRRSRGNPSVTSCGVVSTFAVLTSGPSVKNPSVNVPPISMSRLYNALPSHGFVPRETLAPALYDIRIGIEVDFPAAQAIQPAPGANRSPVSEATPLRRMRCRT